MSYPFSGERVEVLAIAMASAVGGNFLTMDEPGRQYLRRCANAALYRLGGEGAAAQHGVTHLRDALAEVSAAIDAAAAHMRGVPGDAMDRLMVAGAQARAAGAAIFEAFEAAQIETRNAALEKRPVMIPAAPEEPEEEEAI